MHMMTGRHGLDWVDESATRLPGRLVSVRHAAAGDINGDGYPDLLLGTGGSDEALMFLLNDGSGRFCKEE